MLSLLLFCLSFSVFAQNPSVQELQSPLYSRNVDLIKKVLNDQPQLKKKIFQLNSIGFSPFHFSVATGAHKVASLYLTLKGDNSQVVRISDKFKGRFKVLDHETNKEYNLLSGMSIMDIALKRGDLSFARVLKKKGVSFTPSSTKLPKKYSSMLYAVESLNDNVDLIKWLVKHGQSIHDTYDRVKGTSLLLATQANNFHISSYLLKNKVSPHVIMSNGLTPLYYAISNKNKELVELLLKHKVDVNAILLPQKISLIHRAIMSRSLEMTKLLLKKGAKVQVKDKFGRTPFHYSIIVGEEKIMNLLLNKYSININEGDGQESALSLALRHERPNIALSLIKKNANIHTLDKDKNPLVTIAVKKRYFHVVRAMIKRKVKLTIKDSKGKTTLDYGRKSPDRYIRSLF